MSLVADHSFPTCDDLQRVDWFAEPGLHGKSGQRFQGFPHNGVRPRLSFYHAQRIYNKEIMVE